MERTNEIRVWDPLVRIFHWSLVATFITAYLSGDAWDALHTLAGYVVLGLILFRIAWGFIGGRYARFSDFVRPPRQALDYLKALFSSRPRRYLGHNPAGGLMVVALLASLLITTASGLAVFGTEGEGLLGPWLWQFAHWEDALEEVHEFFANFTLLLVGVHVAAVVLSSKLHGEKLVQAMLTGRKSAE